MIVRYYNDNFYMYRLCVDYLQCSGRGTCDAVTGACACERGFKGPACNDMTDDQVRGATASIITYIASY